MSQRHFYIFSVLFLTHTLSLAIWHDDRFDKDEVAVFVHPMIPMNYVGTRCLEPPEPNITHYTVKMVIFN